MESYNFQAKSFYNQNCTIRYWYRAGTSDKYMMLFHGAGCDHLMFEKQTELFDSSCHIIIWDARGHGLSEIEAPYQFEFADMLADCMKLYKIHQIKTATLIGQSMGGNLAQAVAYHYPDKIEKLVIIESTQNTQKLNWLEQQTLKYARAMFALYPWKAYVSAASKMCGTTAYTRNYTKKQLMKMGKQKHVDVMLAVLNLLHEDTSYRFKIPVLLLYGEESKAGNIQKIVKIWAASDDMITLKAISRARHCANMDNPKAVNEHIVQFLVNKL